MEARRFASTMKRSSYGPNPSSLFQRRENTPNFKQIDETKLNQSYKRHLLASLSLNPPPRVLCVRLLVYT